MASSCFYPVPFQRAPGCVCHKEPGKWTCAVPAWPSHLQLDWWRMACQMNHACRSSSYSAGCSVHGLCCVSPYAAHIPRGLLQARVHHACVLKRWRCEANHVYQSHSLNFDPRVGQNRLGDITFEWFGDIITDNKTLEISENRWLTYTGIVAIVGNLAPLGEIDIFVRFFVYMVEHGYKSQLNLIGLTEVKIC